jgi:hypothetical protein
MVVVTVLLVTFVEVEVTVEVVAFVLMVVVPPVPTVT